MPEKNPELWAVIWAWIQSNANWNAIQGAIAAILISFLRAAFMGKKHNCWRRLLDSSICGFIASATIPVCTQIFGHNNYSIFVGVMIGFIGTEKLREFLFKFLNKQVKKETFDEPYNRGEGYDEDK